MENDPAAEQAHDRARLGLCRQTTTTWWSLPDPARGGTQGYPVSDREYQMERAAASHEVKASDVSIWR